MAIYLSDFDIDENVANEAAAMISKYLIRYGRVSVWQAKEKYGTVRVYCTLGFYNIHSITHPGHAWVRYPKWLSYLDNKYGVEIAKILNKIILPYHCWLYRRAYKRAIDKFPFCRENILQCADFPGLLDGI